eukprot:6741361-Prymnesium_polylepis.1
MSSLRAEHETALDAVRAGTGTAAALGARPVGLGAGGGRLPTRAKPALGPADRDQDPRDMRLGLLVRFYKNG